MSRWRLLSSQCGAHQTGWSNPDAGPRRLGGGAAQLGSFSSVILVINVICIYYRIERERERDLLDIHAENELTLPCLLCPFITVALLPDGEEKPLQSFAASHVFLPLHLAAGSCARSAMHVVSVCRLQPHHHNV